MKRQIKHGKILLLLFITGWWSFSGVGTSFAGYFLKSAKWDSPKISVCWEEPTSSNADARSYVQEAVKVWGKVSNINFTGWDACRSDSDGIRIKWYDEYPGPVTKDLGKKIDGVKNGMALNYIFNEWDPIDDEYCQKNRELCIKSIAIHEFGHALGFAHEELRDDTPDECYDLRYEQEEHDEPYGDREIGKWDSDSVMNTCRPGEIRIEDGLKLSKGNISMVQEIYGSSNGSNSPEDPHAGYKHDVGLDAVKVREHGRSKWRDKIEVDLNDVPDMDFRARLKRKGDVWEDVCVDFYLSDDKDYDTDEDQHLGRKCKDLTDEEYADKEKKSVKLKDVDMADYLDNEDTWYVFVEVHYDGGVNRSSESDSDERAKIIVTDTTPLTDGTFVWSPNGPVSGMTCTQWKEPADPHSWGDNFLCTTRSEDIRWSADGPIAGMRCIQIYESQDPHFLNNYLCVPDESELNFVWSESGNMSDMYCVRTDEPKDKHSWDDNYLCWSDGGANGAGLSGIYYGSYDTVTTNTGATSPDVLPASIHLDDASGNVRAIYTPAEVPGLPDIAVRIENIGAVPSSSEQKHKLKTSVFLTGPGYESGWKFTNKQTQISGFGTAGYTENIAFDLPSDAVLSEGLYSITVTTDDTDKLTESNELNNTSPEVRFWVQNALPDIAVQGLSVGDNLTEVEAGNKHDITIDVGNIAPVGGDARFPVIVQLWYDGDQLLGEQVIEATDLIAGGSTEVTISDWTVPFEEGMHTLTATATNKYVPYEANLSNNTFTQNITITVTPGEPNCVVLNPMDDLPETGNFDMSASFLEFPDNISQGDEMHPKVLLCGVSGVLPKTRAIWAYARCDGTGFTQFDDDGEDDIQAGECDEERVNTDRHKATMDPGMYVMYFVANGVSRIPESDHSNNVQAKAFLVEE